MGLPQELINHIMDILHDDLRALKACSLTCKAMFSSTRRLIHRTLWLTQRNIQSVLAQEGESLYPGLATQDVALRFLTCMGESGLLQYSRQVLIHVPRRFTPDILLPHLHHFKSLDRVHTLTIQEFEPILWVDHYKTCFAHFYPTLTSLALLHAFYPSQHITRFALQFPKLENLSLKWLIPGFLYGLDVAVPAISDKSAPLRGHLRLAGYATEVEWPTGVDSINFRSVEVDEPCRPASAQRTLNMCARTLESLTVAILINSTSPFSYLPGCSEVTCKLSTSSKHPASINRLYQAEDPPPVNPPVDIRQSLYSLRPPTTH